nr:MAG TPA: hypothetical protein [Bacteriophage sp.]
MVPINIHKKLIEMVPIIRAILRLEIWVPIKYNKLINKQQPESRKLPKPQPISL